MARAKKITTAAIMKAVNNDDVHAVVIGGGENSIEIPVKTRLSLADRSGMVRDIASMVFVSDENGNEKYAPYLERFAREYSVMNYFTDIELPKSTDKIWEFLDTTRIADKILEIRHRYIIEIFAEAEAMIEYKKDATLRKSKLDELLSGVIDLVKIIREKTDGIDETQIVEYVQENFPEFKDMIGELLKGRVSTTVDE